eukprot:g4284.t1
MRKSFVSKSKSTQQQTMQPQKQTVPPTLSSTTDANSVKNRKGEDVPLKKLRGFIEYERNPEGYRDPVDRIQDWDEINVSTSDRDPVERRRQAARCMDCGTPFCHTHTGCPVNNLIPEWNALVYDEHWQLASERLHATNNFPEFTGRVCPAPCEGSCVAGLIDKPVTIKNIEYAIVDRAWNEGWITPRTVAEELRARGKSVAVVGSGPAGLACADELNQLGHTVDVFERDDRIGGLLMYGIPNMKLDKGTVERRVNMLETEGIRFHPNSDIDSTRMASLRNEYDAVVLCIGSMVPRDLKVPGRDLDGVHFAMDFLRLNMQKLYDGKNYDASGTFDLLPEVFENIETGNNDHDDGGEKKSDFISAKGKKVIVIGGGDTGTDCIGTAVRHGCTSVINFELLEKPPSERASTNPWPEWPTVFNVDYGHAEAKVVSGEDPRSFSTVTKRFIPDQETGKRIAAVETVQVEKYTHPDGSLELREVRGSSNIVECDLVILAMGFVHPEQTLAHSMKLATDARGNIHADYGDFSCFSEDNGINEAGVFAAGDCRRGQSLVVWAINEGRGVSRRAHEYLSAL